MRTTSVIRSAPFVAMLAVSGISLALSSPVQGALAGNPGYSGSLSSNRILRKQQLICDPSDPATGSASTSYDPSVSILSRIDPFRDPMGFDGYVISTAYVEIFDSGSSSGRSLVSVPTGQNFSISSQSGYVQVFYQSAAGTQPGVSGIPPGYTFMERAGVMGQNTHAFLFDVPTTVPDDQILSYTTFADAGGRNIMGSGVLSSPDRLTNTSGAVVGPGTGINIAPATVGAALTPEPAAAGLIAAGGLLLLRRHRRATPRGG